MARTYTPGPAADAIVERLLAKGHYSSADEVVRACLQLLQRHDAELNDLMRLAKARESPTAEPWRRDGPRPW